MQRKFTEKQSLQLNNLLSNYQIQSRWIGRQYIREIIEVLYFDSSLIKSLNHHVYPVIANKYNTSIQSIEKSVRNAINKSNFKSIDITNKTFIANIIEQMKGLCK